MNPRPKRYLLISFILLEIVFLLYVIPLHHKVVKHQTRIQKPTLKLPFVIGPTVVVYPKKLRLRRHVIVVHLQDDFSQVENVEVEMPAMKLETTPPNILPAVEPCPILKIPPNPFNL